MSWYWERTLTLITPGIQSYSGYQSHANFRQTGSVFFNLNYSFEEWKIISNVERDKILIQLSSNFTSLLGGILTSFEGEDDKLLHLFSFRALLLV